MEVTSLYWILLMFSFCQGGASLKISPNRSQFFEYESVSLSCEVQGNSTGWRLKRYTVTRKLSDCGTGWGTQQGSSCTITLMTTGSGEYWCESRSGQHSYSVNIRVHGGDVILETPILPVTEGHNVTLNCRYKKTPSNLTADFYKDGSLIRTESTGVMTIPAVNKSDQGLYKCNNSQGESPESRMTVTGQPHVASLIISPNRSQFIEYESVSLTCEVQGNSTGWRLKRYTVTRKMSECGTDWGKRQGSLCNTTLKTSDTGKYWCESGFGEQSNAVDITVYDGRVILESHDLPVTEGHSVTLSCRYKKTPSDLTADFYKDGSLIRTESTGEMTIPAVKKSDQGLYSCRHPELGRSPDRWMTVTAPIISFFDGSPSPPVPGLPMSLSRLLCSLLVVSPYLVVTTVLMVKYSRNRRRAVDDNPTSTQPL